MLLTPFFFIFFLFSIDIRFISNIDKYKDGRTEGGGSGGGSTCMGVEV